MEKTIDKLKDQARDSWRGEVGEERAEKLEMYLRNKLAEYSNALDIPQEEILEAWEKDRSYNAINYYQEANQPAIENDNVKVFDNIEEMLKAIGEQKFRCPACNGISTNPYACNSEKEIQEGKTCDWKVYGLFGDLGKGVYVFVKDQVKGENIFMPISWEKEFLNKGGNVQN